MSTKKRIISLILAVIMVVSVVPVSMLTVSAASYKYPAYFEVTKSSDGKKTKSGDPAAVYHTEAKGDSKSYLVAVGSLLTIVGETKNSEGNTWYKIKKINSDDGSVYYRWIWDKYVSYRGSFTEYSSATYMETKNGGKCWNKPWSNETSKSSTSSNLGNGVVVRISRKINRNGTIWYKVYNKSQYIFSDNLKSHSHTTSTISRTNYKSVDSSNHSYTWTYWKCKNSTCPQHVKDSKTQTKAHNYNNGYCPDCGAWKAKSTSSVNNVKYIILIDGAKVHNAPYGASPTTTTLSKGKLITVTQKIVNGEGNTWYKYSGGYVSEKNSNDVVQIKSHASCTWDKGTITKAATCTAAGTKKYTCTLCGGTKTEAIAKLGHTFTGDYGYCTRCGYYNVKSKKTINNVKYEIVKKAKAHNGPFEKCSVVEDNIPVGKIIVVTEEINNGSNIWYKYDGNKYIWGDYVKKHSHSYDSGTITKAATCTAAGTRKKTCKVCGATKTETIAKLGHNYKNGVCTRCKDWKVDSKTAIKNIKYVVTVDNAKVHTAPYGSFKTVATLPKGTTIIVTEKLVNCEGDGGHIWYKYEGGYIYGQYVKEHTSCSWKKTKTIKEATCTAAGQAEYKCTKCNATTTKTIDKLGHNYKDGNNGICTRCKDWRVKSTTDINNKEYIITTDKAKVHNGPYSECKVVKTLTKGATITATQKLVNYQDSHIWYKYSDGYIYEDYVALSCTIKYKSNGGSNAPASTKFAAGSKVKISSTKPTKSGYEFKGWATSGDSTTVKYKSGSSYTFSKSITLYAVWEKCTSHSYKKEVCTKCGKRFSYKVTDYASAKNVYVINDVGAKIWTKPSSTSSDSKNSKTLQYNTCIKVIGYTKNAAGNIWYKISDSQWVYSGNVGLNSLTKLTVHDFNLIKSGKMSVEHIGNKWIYRFTNTESKDTICINSEALMDKFSNNSVNNAVNVINEAINETSGGVSATESAIYGRNYSASPSASYVQAQSVPSQIANIGIYQSEDVVGIELNKINVSGGWLDGNHIFAKVEYVETVKITFSKSVICGEITTVGSRPLKITNEINLDKYDEDCYKAAINISTSSSKATKLKPKIKISVSESKIDNSTNIFKGYMNSYKVDGCGYAPKEMKLKDYIELLSLTKGLISSGVSLYNGDWQSAFSLISSAEKLCTTISGYTDSAPYKSDDNILSYYDKKSNEPVYVYGFSLKSPIALQTKGDYISLNIGVTSNQTDRSNEKYQVKISF